MKYLEAVMDNRIGKYGNQVYHYTSFDVFYKMVTRDEFWLGNLSGMNDKEEMFHFISLLEKYTYDNLSREGMYACSAFFERLRARTKRESFFAMSFSTAEEDASMWDRYGNRGKGVCLAFNTSRILELTSGTTLFFNEEFYSSDLKSHEFVGILSDYFKTGKLSGGFLNEDGLMDNIIAVSIMHKERSFRSEREIRLATIIENGADVSFGNTLYHLCNDRIRKFFVLKLAEIGCSNILDSLIDRVIIGPCSQQNLPELCDFLKFNNLDVLSNRVEKSSSSLYI